MLITSTTVLSRISYMSQVLYICYLYFSQSTCKGSYYSHFLDDLLILTYLLIKVKDKEILALLNLIFRDFPIDNSKYSVRS